MGNRIMPVLVGLSAFTSASATQADPPADPATEWATVYGDFAGTFAVPAKVSLRGEVGMYYPERKKTAWLRDVTYTPGADRTTILATWHYDDERSGWVEFVVAAADPGRIDGRWGHGPRTVRSKPDGYWFSVPSR